MLYCCKSLRFLVLSALIPVTGCSTIAPTAIGRLAAFDPISAQAASVKIAADLPQALRLRDGDVVLTVTLDVSDPRFRLDETFLLAISDQTSVSNLPASSVGRHIQIVQIDPRDRKRLDDALQKARSYRETGKEKGKGKLSASVKGSCRVGVIPEGSLPVRLLMRSDDAENFFPLTRQMNLRALWGDDAIAKIPPCDD